MLTNTELKKIEAEAKAAGCQFLGGFPSELIQCSPTAETIEAGLKAAEEMEELSRNAQPRPRPAVRIAAAWAPVIAKLNGEAA